MHQGETEEDNADENGEEITFHTEIISRSPYTADSSAKNTLWQDDLINTDDIPDSSPLTNTMVCEEVLYGCHRLLSAIRCPGHEWAET